MALLYNKLQRMNPIKPELPKKWYLILKSLGPVGEKEVARMICEGSTLNPKEAEMALARFEKVLIRLLLDGHTVQLGDWGFFELTINCAGAATEKEAVVANIKKVNIRFRPGKELKEAINTATFKPAADLSNRPAG